jgi:hypothetical protein
LRISGHKRVKVGVETFFVPPSGPEYTTWITPDQRGMGLVAVNEAYQVFVPLAGATQNVRRFE